jgi:hypothetical protein
VTSTPASRNLLDVGLFDLARLDLVDGLSTLDWPEVEQVRGNGGRGRELLSCGFEHDCGR